MSQKVCLACPTDVCVTASLAASMFFLLQHSSSIALGMDSRLLPCLCCIMAQLQLADHDISACTRQDLLGIYLIIAVQPETKLEKCL